MKTPMPESAAGSAIKNLPRHRACRLSRDRFAALLGLLLVGAATSAHTATQPNAWQIADVSNAGGSGGLFYTNNLTPAQRVAATNSGWHFTVVSRLVAPSPDQTPAQFMTYGNGNHRFVVAWDTNGFGQLTAQLFGGVTTNLTAAGQATNDYHIHELVYDPVSQLTTYLFDGAAIFTWSGLADGFQNGTALWGANSSLGRGTMNYHHVTFSINGLGTVSEYDAGFAGNPATAPDPTNQVWTLTPPGTPGAVTNTPVSPDTVALPLPNAWQITDNTTAIGAFLNYTTNLSAAVVNAATNAGWRYTLTSRLVNDFGASVAMTALFGDGTNRYGMAFDFDPSGNLILTGSGGFSQQVAAAGNGARDYHTFEMSGTNGRVSFYFDGAYLTNRPGDSLTNQANQVFWGSLSSAGEGQMNFHRAEFWVNGYGRVAAYNAGFEDNPAEAPNPATQGWIRNSSGGLGTEGPVSSDSSQDSRFEQVAIPGLPGVWDGSVAWADYDNDGRLDFLLTGFDSSDMPRSQLWRNTGNGFTNVPIAGLPGVDGGLVAWGDYDNDGHLDFLLTGYSSASGPISQLSALLILKLGVAAR